MRYSLERLAVFVVSTKEEDFPEPVLLAGRRSVLDTIAACLGGVPTENARSMRDAARESFGPGQFRPWFARSEGLHPLGALLANCAAASALDIDDGHRAAAGHPGAAIVPAVLMKAAEMGSSGRATLTAIIAGYETALRIAESRHLPDDVSFASGIWTGFGVAAGLARLESLSPERTAHAMAIAGAEAPANLPQGACMASSVKGSSPWSTVTAAVAVQRARAGASGSIDLLDRSGKFDAPLSTALLGDRWLVTETYFKPYASCRYTHPVIDAIVSLMAGHQLKPDNITAIDIDIFPEAEKLPNAIAPVSLEDAQFSLPFTAALAAVRGITAFRPLRPDVLGDEPTLRLSRRVRLAFPEDMAGMFPLGTPARVTLTCGDNRYTEHVPMPLGDATNPLSDDEMREKFFDLGRDVLSEHQLSRLIIAIDGMIDDPSFLFRRLAG